MYIGMLFPPLHFLFKPFNDLILRIVQSGLIDHWLKGMTGPDRRTKIKREPVVLTWDHLYVGFYIYLGCLALSTAGFVAEILYFRLNFFIRSWFIARLGANIF